MFSRETVDRAIQYTQSVRSNEQAVFPADVELGKIVESHIFPLMNTKGVSLAKGDLATITQFLAGKGAEEESDVLDGEASRIAGVIQNNIDLARKVALPIINTATQLIDNQLEGMTEEMRNSISVDIRPNPIYELMVGNATLGEVVKDAANTSYTEYAGGIRAFPKATYETIVQLCRTGSSEFDNLVVDVFKHAGEQLVKYLYDMNLCQDHPRTYQRSLRRDEQLVLWLMGYAICSNAKGDAIPEGINLSLEEFSRKALEYRAVCRTAMKKFVDDYRFREKTGSLVYDSYRDSHGQLHLNVIPSVYEQAVNQGITADIIVGSTLVDGGTWHLSSLVRDKDIYLKAFIAHNEKMSAELRKRRGDVIVSALNQAVNGVLENADVQVKNLNWGEIKNKLHSQISFAENADPNDIMINFIMSHLFEGTLVPRIVRSMNELSVDCPDARPEELAAKVATMLTVDHMLSRVKLVPSH